MSSQRGTLTGRRRDGLAVVITANFRPVPCGVGDYSQQLWRRLGSTVEATAEVVTGSVQGLAAEEWQEGVLIRRVVSTWNWPQVVNLARIAQGRAVVNLQYQGGSFSSGKAAICLLPLLLRWYGRRSPPRPRIIVTFHDLDGPRLFPRAGRLRRLGIWLLALFAAANICTNEADARALRRLPGVSETRVHVVPLAPNVPIQPSSFGVQNTTPALDGHRLLHFGLLLPEKRVESVLEAFARVRQHLPDAVLTMVGAVPPGHEGYRLQLERLSAQLGIGDSVEWAGEVPAADISGRLARADACLLPFKRGVTARSTTFLAAMASGAAVVTTYGPELPAGLVDGGNVILVPPSDPCAMADAAVRLLTDRTLNAAIRRRAATWATPYTWPEVVNRYRVILRSLLRPRTVSDSGAGASGDRF